MRINEATGYALRAFWPVVEMELPRTIEAFYQDLLAEPNLATLTRTQVEGLKSAQGAHWARLFSGRFDEVYIKGARRIGLVHSDIGLEPRWYIGGYAYALSYLTDLAIDTYYRKPLRVKEVITAVNSAIMLDIDFVVAAYKEAMLVGEKAKRQTAVHGLIKSLAAVYDDGIGEGVRDAEPATGIASQKEVHPVAAEAPEAAPASPVVFLHQEQPRRQAAHGTVDSANSAKPAASAQTHPVLELKPRSLRGIDKPIIMTVQNQGSDRLEYLKKLARKA